MLFSSRQTIKKQQVQRLSDYENKILTLFLLSLLIDTAMAQENYRVRFDAQKCQTVMNTKEGRVIAYAAHTL